MRRLFLINMFNNLYVIVVTHLQEYTFDFRSVFSILAVFFSILVYYN